MNLIQISEPQQQNTQHNNLQKNAIGIDLGTTNSLVATIEDGEPIIIQNEQGKKTLPSTVTVNEDGFVIGADPLEQLNNNSLDPENTILSIKRFLGKSLKEIQENQNKELPYKFLSSDNNLPIFVTKQGHINTIEITAKIITKIKQIAETKINHIDGAVITVPAYFDDSQRQATKEAAKLAGLKVLRLINEPTAAAVAYGLHEKTTGNIVVYDLGGGTFDVSVLEMEQGLFKVLATGGDTDLGGDDFDLMLANYIATKINLNAETAQKKQKLVIYAKKIKEQLSKKQQVTATIQLDDNAHKITITQDDLNLAISKKIKDSIRICKQTLKKAQLETTNIDQIILVGGSTKIPIITKELTKFFAKQPLSTLDPEKVVAIGAAIQANTLVGNKNKEEMLLLDVTPLSLGVETIGGIVETIIPRSTSIPIIKTQEFTNYDDKQTAMSFHIVQGEREMADKCRSLGKFELKNLPQMPAGTARIKVDFQIDADGLLTVSATETTTKTKANIQIVPSFGLTQAEIERMISKAYEQAQADIDKKKLAKQLLKANKIIQDTEKALTKNRSLLNNQDLDCIEKSIYKLKKLIQQNNSQAIMQETNHLDTISTAFANKIIQQAVEKSTQNK